MKGGSRKIQTTIALAFASLVLGTAVILALISYTFTREAVEETSRAYTAQLIEQVQANIDSYVDHMENIAEVVQLNDQVQRFLVSVDSIPPEERGGYRERISSFLKSIARTRPDISLILIAGDNGEVLTQEREVRLNEVVSIEDQEWYRRAREVRGRAVVSSSRVQNVLAGQYPWVITLSRTINDPVTGEVHGVMLVDLTFSVIRELLSSISLGDRGYLFIVAPDGSIVYHPRQELIYSDLEQEYHQRVLEHPGGSFYVVDQKGERLYTVTSSDRTGWKTVGVNYTAELVRNRVQVQRYYFYWTLLCVVFAILLSLFISHHLSRPILRLRSTMRSVEGGNFDISADVSGNNEISELAKDFNIMVARIRELVRRNGEEQEEKRRSELMALQNQITPHFLYNTLDSIIWMAETREHGKVVKMVAALARLLRLSISRGDELVPIRDEITHIENYLTIQKMRYQDMLDFSVEVEEEILSLLVPKVILQPLVENAIYHGVKNNSGGGRVLVGGRRKGEQVVLYVEDDGVGANPDEMAAILEGTARNGTSPDPPTAGPARGGGTATAAKRGTLHSRVGVRNVHERIKLYFGDQYGLRFLSGSGGVGTVVELRVPIVREHRNGGGSA
ncbi:MAG: cache domain-containing sensor histidine kinase [Alkalispirochaetaceae bacterium]